MQFRKEQVNKDRFRDILATIDEKGNRVWVYAKKARGTLTTYRNIIGIILLIFLYAGPFLSINGEPLLLLDFLNRKIILFGIRFWPQDFHMMFLAMISLFVFVILFTVTYGRVWCGWTCPQTVLMELVFRRIEFWIEGSARTQKIRNNKPWDIDKIWRKTSKHLVFIIISIVTINTFAAYIIGPDELFKIVGEGPLQHAGTYIALLAFSGLFYFVFSWFREQVCTIVCPYGRLQGVLLDKNSIVVAYDYKRGEPRGTFRVSEDRAKAEKGNCINCTQCIQVCPAGIDIRNGTQLECINCAICIDACNGMMKKVGLPTGLIRYTSEKLITEGRKLRFNARSIAYSVVLVLLLGLISYSFFNRSDIETTILRTPGMLYQEQDDGRISNLYTIKLVNKTNGDLPVELKITSHDGEIKMIGDPIRVKGHSVGESVFFLILNPEDITSDKLGIEFRIYTDDRELSKIESTFVGPNQTYK